MQNAGLNPILAYQQGGAGAPSGASASNISPDYSDATNGVASSAKSYIDQKRERGLADSAIDLQAAQAKTQETQQKANLASAKKANAEANTTEKLLPSIQARANLDKREAEAGEKMFLYDQVMNRVGQVANVVGSAKGLSSFKSKTPSAPGEPGRISVPVPPAKNELPDNWQKLDLGTTKSGHIFNKKTGEIYD